MRLLLLLLLVLSRVTSQASAGEPLQHSRQSLLVLTDAWNATKGVMYVFERDEIGSPWNQREAIAVVIGRTGMAWGRGLMDVADQPGPAKREGDGCAPAGIFRLSSAFGRAAPAQVRDVRLPYRMLRDDTEAIDDPKSRYYNRIVSRRDISAPDWNSSEKMLAIGAPYQWGVVIDHNADPVVPGAGSCLFIHVWSNEGQTTAGCTAMSEPNLRRLITWLDPARQPKLVQLPRPLFEQVAGRWKLPQPQE